MEFDSQQLCQRLLLIGDAGWPRSPEPVLLSLRDTAHEELDKTRIIFLGDNVYLNGMPPEAGKERSAAEGRLNRQLEAVSDSGAKGVFIPGNHEWRKSSYKSAAPDFAVRPKAEAKFIHARLGGGADFRPQPGCLGPDYIDLPGVRLIIFDSALLIDRLATPDPALAKDATGANPASFFQSLSELLRTGGDRKVIVLAHHPPATHGQHGGFYDFRDHIFPLTRLPQTHWLWAPLPVIGSLYPAVRLAKNDPENLSSPAYQEMNKKLLSAFRAKPPLFYAAGHEHNLQILTGSKAGSYILVSGAGSKTMLTTATHGTDTIFSHLHTGFMALDFMRNGDVLLRVIEPADKEGHSIVAFSKWFKGHRG